MPPNLKPGEEARARRDRLCQRCKGISAEQLAKPKGYAHHSTLEGWISSTASCRLCCLFWQEFCPQPSHHSDGYKIIRPAHTLGYAGKAIEDAAFQQSHRLSIQLKEGEDMCRLVATNFTDKQYSANLPEKDIPLTYVEIFTDENDPATGYGVPFRRTLPHNTGCETSMHIARLWLSQCLESHCEMQYSETGSTYAACERNSTAGTYVAARLLEISATQVRAVPASGVQQPYATLSYSWGEGLQWPWGPQKLERHEVSAIAKTGLCRNSLPKTMREAVWVAEQLGLRYIWIDVLCIKQDGVDFLAESVKMAAIYSQAHINISASHSASNRAGLFNTRSRPQHHNFAACIPVDSIVDGRPSRLWFYQRSDDRFQPDIPGFPNSIKLQYDAYRQEIDHGRLSQRSWALQERICSPRILHFGATQLFWQCNRVTRAEDNISILESRETRLDSMKPWKVFFFPSEFSDLTIAGEARSKEDVANNWRLGMARTWSHEIVPEYYSRRKMTNHSDRLLAIAGLARNIWEQQQSLRYYAGLWSVSTPDSLLWYTQIPGRRITPYVAPSWSWASVQGEVIAVDDIAVGDDDDVAFHCKVIDCQITTLGADQFGPVTDASLEVEAAALEGRLYKRRDDYHVALELNSHGAHYVIYGWTHLDDERDDTVHVYALLIKELHVTMLSFTGHGWHLLLIAPKDETKKTFVRVGLAYVKIPTALNLPDTARFVLV